ncbi:MAG: DUF72 domain-containing protein [Burkholderiaceae bacterium]
MIRVEGVEARRIRVGVGGWTYEPWRNNFFPEGLPRSRELHYASRQLTAIEINSTYYSNQKPASFAKWRDETPEGFMFSLKASRYATHRKRLADAGEAIERFVASGISELGDKLGPIVWQFMPSKPFEPEDFEAFLALLPNNVDGLALRHVLDVRHASFKTPDYLKLARQYKCASVFTDADDYPSFADLSADFVYARLMRSDAKLKTGYAPKALDRWAEAAKTWAAGGEPDELPRVQDRGQAARPREVFMFFINGAKERAPAAAMALLKRLAVEA